MQARTIALTRRRDYDSILPMKHLSFFVLVALALLISLAGCSSGPSPEQQAREADQQRDSEHQQAEFRKGLPPVANPGQGW